MTYTFFTHMAQFSNSFGLAIDNFYKNLCFIGCLLKKIKVLITFLSDRNGGRLKVSHTQKTKALITWNKGSKRNCFGKGHRQRCQENLISCLYCYKIQTYCLLGWQQCIYLDQYSIISFLGTQIGILLTIGFRNVI